jgi:alpha-1,3-rhamnosyltransferase
MKVSVVVPSYNHYRFISETINSVLGQSFKDFELIVIDDGSSDNSQELIKKLALDHGFKYLLKENEGICQTLNRGIELSAGEYVVFLASDDYIPIHRLKEQVEFLDSNPEVDVVTGGVTLVDEFGRELKVKHPPLLGNLEFHQLLKRNIIFAPTAMIRKSVFDSVGFYNPKISIEDYDLWLRILSRGLIIRALPSMWAFYRITSLNLENRFRWYRKGYNEVLSQYLPNPEVAQNLRSYSFIYATKMVLLLGFSYFRENKDNSKDLSLFKKNLLIAISLCPRRVRHKILNFLLINY